MVCCGGLSSAFSIKTGKFGVQSLSIESQQLRQDGESRHHDQSPCLLWYTWVPKDAESGLFGAVLALGFCSVPGLIYVYIALGGEPSQYRTPSLEKYLATNGLFPRLCGCLLGFSFPMLLLSLFQMTHVRISLSEGALSVQHVHARSGSGKALICLTLTNSLVQPAVCHLPGPVCVSR